MTEQVQFDRRQPVPERHAECKHESKIISLDAGASEMRKTLEGVSTKLDLILAQITKVAVLEEKHSNQTADVNRAHSYIAKLEKDVDTLSIEVREFMAYSRGMARTAWAVWGLLSGLVMGIFIKMIFFMGANGIH
jgi:tetrahydromethanopterin S-methyltransferase subunit G